MEELRGSAQRIVVRIGELAGAGGLTAAAAHMPAAGPRRGASRTSAHWHDSRRAWHLRGHDGSGFAAGRAALP